ncbi:MAG TPA: amidohydrolase family protein [Baekduia sp.]|nr:amidohydrolase family protein [Baekduia sp.]
MIVDSHVHVLDHGHWPDAWWDHVAKAWAEAEDGRRPDMVRDRIEGGLIDPLGDRMVADMDDAGVDWVVNLAWDWGPDYPAPATVDELEAHAKLLAQRHANRIIPFAGIDPRRERAAERFEQWVVEDGIRGLKLYPPCGWWPKDQRAFALYEVCVRHDLPVLFHTGDPLPLLDGDYSRPKHLLPVVEAFPDLKLWIGHAGAHGGWDEALEVAAASKAAKLEMSVWLWDTSTHDDEVDVARRIGAARDAVGADRIIFGTDHVSGSKERRPGFLKTVTDMFLRLPETAREAGTTISSEELDLIMGANAARDLKIENPVAA